MDAEDQNGLETLDIDVLNVRGDVVICKAICLPQENEGKARHRDVVIAYECQNAEM